MRHSYSTRRCELPIIRAMSEPASVAIRDDTIDLDQFLKLADVASSGGEAKYFIKEGMVTVNGEPEDRRRRTLRIGDIVSVIDFGDFEVASNSA